MISRDNYEIAFIDYLDGTLPAEQEEELRAFLQHNPDLNDELLAMKDMILPDDSCLFEDKEALKNIVFTDETIFNETCVASIEGDLSSSDEARLQDFIRTSPAHAHSYSLFKHVLFSADNSIVFPNKSLLYRKPMVAWFSPQLAAIAAAIIVALILMGTLQTRLGSLNKDYMASGISYQIKIPKSVAPSKQEKRELAQTNINTKPKRAKYKNEKAKHSVPQNKESEFVQHEIRPDEPPFEELQLKRGQMPTLIYVYRPQLSLNTTQASRRLPMVNPLEKVNQVGRSLLTDKEGKLKSIPRKDIQSGVLTALNKVTNQRLNFETDEKGKIKKLTLNGDLLALTIPLSKNKQ